MSYDVYCYRPQSDDRCEGARYLSNRKREQLVGMMTKLEVSNAKCRRALKYNPRLEPFKVDHNEVARLMKITYERANGTADHIELNPPEGDLRDTTRNSWTTFPNYSYWLHGCQGRRVFHHFHLSASYPRHSGVFRVRSQTDDL